MKIIKRFRIWFDDGAITPGWVVGAIHEEDDDHTCVGIWCQAGWQERDLVDALSKYHNVKESELEFI